MAMTDEELDQFEKDLMRNERQFNLQNRALELERQKLGPTREEQMRAAEEAERDHWAAMRRENDERRTRELANAPAGRYAAIAQRDARAKVAAWDAEAERDRRAAAENDIRKVEAEKKVDAANLQGAEAARLAGEANRFAAEQKANADKYNYDKRLEGEKAAAEAQAKIADAQAKAAEARLAAEREAREAALRNSREITEARIEADKAKADADRASREKIAEGNAGAKAEKSDADAAAKERAAWLSVFKAIMANPLNVNKSDQELIDMTNRAFEQSKNLGSNPAPTPEPVQTSAVKRAGGWRYGIA